jgi:hypothetical protein
MRRLACIGIMLAALAACQSIPSVIRIEVDGSTLEFKKKEPPEPDAESSALEGNAVEGDAPGR